MTADGRNPGGGHTARRVVVFVLVVVAALALGGLGSGVGDGPATGAREPAAGATRDPTVTS